MSKDKCSGCSYKAPHDGQVDCAAPSCIRAGAIPVSKREQETIDAMHQATEFGADMVAKYSKVCAQLAASHEDVKKWKALHAASEQLVEIAQRSAERANKRIEEAEKQEPFKYGVEDIDGVLVTVPLYTRPIPPADVVQRMMSRLADMLDENQFAEMEHLATSAGIETPADVVECTRSHPHENMSAMCELRTQIAKLDNEASHNADLNNRQALRITELERKLAEREVIFHVNMLRAWPEKSHDEIAAAISSKGGTTEELNKLLSEAREEGRKEAVPDVDWLSNVIRTADGSHTLGAGALAESIVEAMLAAAPSPASLNAKEGGE